MSTTYRVEGARPSDAQFLAEVLAEAFSAYAWTSWIVPADRRADRLRALFELTVGEVGLPYGEVWVARGPEDTVVGGIVVLRPDREVPSSVREAIGAQEEAILGDRLEVSNAADAACARLRPTAPHLTIATMGVSPAYRRRGIARALLQPALALADELGAPAYLETSSEANVALYSSVGFEVSGHLVIPDGGPPVWAMRRPPAGSAASAAT
ncbi:GNAT family N-acetyltransferase [Ornithinimicrobium humiphilum]|uniref:Acetyltransferase (GNAT) family protein n=1 Tax=Ornithinimicrobium humiphilum TaxID=125288 RepID=A0A543KLW6_9MICO|nr:GNAT family N-acetyltransferase [Ornithinimicrobium humiphilum]TQM96077.1 acetyltransferase (GNAT) family protein [Ornithinimicrobium humiphilum]